MHRNCSSYIPKEDRYYLNGTTVRGETPKRRKGTLTTAQLLEMEGMLCKPQISVANAGASFEDLSTYGMVFLQNGKKRKVNSPNVVPSQVVAFAHNLLSPAGSSSSAFTSLAAAHRLVSTNPEEL